jgi:hypothetical protein
MGMQSGHRLCSSTIGSLVRLQVQVSGLQLSGSRDFAVKYAPLLTQADAQAPTEALATKEQTLNHCEICKPPS